MKLITANEASERLGISRRTLKRHIDSGRLPAYRVGGIKINPDDLPKFIRSCRLRAEVPPHLDVIRRRAGGAR